MLLKIGKFCSRSSIIVLEVAAMFVLVLALIGGGVVWRLKSGPVSLSFAKNYIQDAMSHPEQGINVSLDQAILHWPDLSGPLLLGLRNAKIINDEQKEILSMDNISFSLSKTNLLIGRIAPIAIIFDKPVVNIKRFEDGDMDIGFGRMKSKQDEQAQQYDQQTDILEDIINAIGHPGREDVDSPIASLQALKISSAQIFIEDYSSNISWSFQNLNADFQSTENGMEANITLPLIVEPGSDSKSDIDAKILYDWRTEEFTVQAYLQNLSSQLLAQRFEQLAALSSQDMMFNAQIDAFLSKDFEPINAVFALQSDKGAWVIEDLYQEPLRYENLAFNLQYEPSTQEVKLVDTSVVLGNIPLQLSGVAKIDDHENGLRMAGQVEVQSDRFQQSYLADIWPSSLQDEPAHEWLVHKLSDGMFKNFSYKVDFELSRDLKTNTISTQIFNMLGSFDYEGMTIDYKKNLMPITHANGTAEFNYKEERLDVRLKDGKVGDLAVGESYAELTHFIEAGKGLADIHVKLSGPVSSVFEFVEREPIAANHRFDRARVEGTAELGVNVSLPATSGVRFEDVKINILGKAHDVVLPEVVHSLDLTKALVNISVDDGMMSLKGNGKLASRDVDFEYSRYLESANKPFTQRIKAWVRADPNLREVFGIDLSDFMQGSPLAEITYQDMTDSASYADVKLDLTPATLFFEPLGYNKNVGQAAHANLRAILNDGQLVEIENLNIEAEGLSLQGGRLLFQTQGEKTLLWRGQLPNVNVGRTRAAIDLESPDAQKMKISLQGASLDLTAILSPTKINKDKNDHQTSAAREIFIDVENLYTSDERFVDQGKIFASLDRNGRFNQLELDARAGQGDIYLRYKVDESGKRTFRFEADDAGAALRAFDMYESVQGGQLVIYAEPKTGLRDRNLNGVAQMSNFRVVDAPVLARLIGALSPRGLDDLLGNEGVAFSRLEANIDWLYRPEGSLLVIQDGRTSGSELGLTFDGVFDNAQGSINVDGTIIPLSTVNKILGNIPIIGEILGGSGGVFAATYKIEGKADEPDISVNPLSVLAPGILRRILFENNDPVKKQESN